ncbi:ras-associating and dilute domain-containing protein-like isoform X2 [Patiria miniata]|nr:ras-associating and dilute domain-containing protein-like isoform X2 [Patiria miniata]
MEPLQLDNQLAPQPVSNNSNSAAAQRKSLSQFFGVESADLAVPYYAGSTATSPTTKPKFGSLSPKFNKKQNSVDTASLSSNGSTKSSNQLSVSYAKRSKSIGNIGNGGLLLKTDTPNFIRKFQSSEGPLRSFIKKDKGNPGKVSSKGSGLGPRRRSRAKSLSGMFERGLTLLKKDEASTPVKEVASEDSAPGLLKIFGDKICPNATYKSVLASAQSSAVALVKVVLERYSLCVNTFEDYVLCDVIGYYKANPEKASRILGISEDFEEKQEWITECMRVLGDDDRPLAVKSYWKPEVGFARRFEIRRRADISVPDTDTITHGINLNAKRLQMTRANRALTDASLASFPEDQDRMSEDLSSSSEQEIMSEEPQRQLSQSQSEKEETEGSNEQLPLCSLLPPQDFPYLLTLHGDSPESDQILYLLDSISCLIGHTPDAKADVELDSCDVNQEHCRILTQYNSNDDNANHNPFDMSLEPVEDSKVFINGTAVSQRTKVNTGDLIGIGDHYLFLLKNPLAQLTAESPLTRLLSLANQSDSWTHLTNLPNPEMVSQPKYASPRIASKAQEYSADKRRLKLSYAMRHEDELLRWIASLLASGSPKIDGSDEFVLSLAYLTCMCVEHSAYNFHQERTKRLMMKVASLIQALAWDKTKEMARTQPEKPSDVQSAMEALLPDLQLIVCLLTNALEILNFLQSSMGDYVAMSQGTRPNTDGDEVESSLGIEDEALVELEEVVMYTFQQTVYYLTKTLYISIPNFLDTNPFADDGDDDDVKTKGMDSVLMVFQMTFDLMRDLGVHPEITSQLFAYLLFFTNASLFNMLVERGADGKFYKWSKGAQIRGNLDVLEAWVQDHGLQDQSKFLTRVSMAIDLLATPKVQLIQANWSSLQSDFSELNTVQLHHFLSQYQLATNQSRPTHWHPPAEEMKSATDTENLLEPFDNHPALALPNHGFELDLQQPITSQHFINQLQELKRRFLYITFSTGSEDKTDSSSLTASQSSSEMPNLGNKSPSSPGSGDISFPVPPPRPRTKPNRYPQSDSDKETATAMEVLKRPLEIVPAAPVSVANTVKLPPSEGSSLSKNEKMSPRVFTNKPLFTNKMMNAVSKLESRVKDDDKTNMTSSNSEPKDCHPSSEIECVDSVTSPAIIPAIVTTEPLESSAPESMNPSQDGGTAIKEQQREEARKCSDGHSEEFKEPKKPCPTLTSSSSTSSVSSACSIASSVLAMETGKTQKRKDSEEEVFVVDLEKGEEGVGLGLIDGMHTSLRSQGIYVRKLVPGGSAVKDGRLIVGDRILAVNGTSLVGADYNCAMQLIRTSGKKLRFLVAKSEPSVALKITAATC